jgi:hypothetical protein
MTIFEFSRPTILQDARSKILAIRCNSIISILIFGVLDIKESMIKLFIQPQGWSYLSNKIIIFTARKNYIKFYFFLWHKKCFAIYRAYIPVCQKHRISQSPMADLRNRSDARLKKSTDEFKRMSLIQDSSLIPPCRARVAIKYRNQ